MKTIDTLVQDILEVVDHGGGWDATVTSFLSSRIEGTVKRRLEEPEESKNTLRMSNLGQPCTRKLWYSINEPEKAEALTPENKLKFLYGDLLEDLLLSLAVAAGHRVEGTQDRLEIDGIIGHRDAVIDGVTVDVKSASSFSFRKFKDHKLREDDPFGYIEQLSSYVYAGKDDPLVTDKRQGAFLVIDKQHGSLCLDVYDFTRELATKQATVERVRKEVGGSSPPPRAFSDEEDGKSGNRKLGLQCSYCQFKDTCWPGLRGFLYSGKPRFLTVVKREPNVLEITDVK